MACADVALASSNPPPPRPNSAVLKLGFAAAAAVVALDQASKAAAAAFLPAPGAERAILGFFNLVHVRNPGVSFGLMPGLGPWALAGFAVAVSAGLAVWLARAESRLTAAALGLVIGGALGNAIDRLRLGAVFDFLDFHAFGYHWPAFNAADAAITVGVIGLLAGSFVDKSRAGRGSRGART